METKLTATVQPDRGEEKEEPGIKIEIRADSLLDLMTMGPPEVSRQEGLIMGTYPVLT